MHARVEQHLYFSVPLALLLVRLSSTHLDFSLSKFLFRLASLPLHLYASCRQLSSYGPVLKAMSASGRPTLSTFIPSYRGTPHLSNRSRPSAAMASALYLFSRMLSSLVGFSSLLLSYDRPSIYSTVYHVQSSPCDAVLSFHSNSSDLTTVRVRWTFSMVSIGAVCTVVTGNELYALVFCQSSHSSRCPKREYSTSQHEPPSAWDADEEEALCLLLASCRYMSSTVDALPFGKGGCETVGATD